MRLFPGKKKPARLERTLAPDMRRGSLSYRIANLQGLGMRERQEDSFAFFNALDVTKIRKKGLMAIVADGMGGMRDGRLASETAIQSLKDDFERMDRREDLAGQLCESVLTAGDRVRELLCGEGGSTLAACFVYQEKLYFASVGDSFIYLKRGQQLYRLNHEHNVRSQTKLEKIRAGSIAADEAPAGREGAALTAFLGMTGLEEVECSCQPFPLEAGDILLLCSDGVGGVLTGQELEACLDWNEPARMCAAMEEEIFRKGNRNQDNYTALVIQCSY